MCFGSKEKGGEKLAPRPAKGASHGDDGKGSRGSTSKQHVPPSGPPPQPSGSGQYAPPPGPPPQQPNQFVPPPGPPALQSTSYAACCPPQYAPPLGPPPTKQPQQHALPPGPPSHDYGPPPGPPQPQDMKPKPEHDWESAVPDTSLFPPPPDFFNGWDRSPASNSSEHACNLGVQWCEAHPLTPPITLDANALQALQTGDIQLMKPWDFGGRLARTGPGRWAIQTDKASPDACVIGYPPLYSVRHHSPLATGRKRTIYYEVLLRSLRSREAAVALGFTALPYPNFRQPGWHRGSMAVHGDDGHKYVNDRWGGASFTAPFETGATYGVGMTFESAGGRVSVTCFFTRDGRVDGTWDLHEELDASVVLPVTGLEGFHDLSCAVGTYQGVECEVVFDPRKWKHRPEGTGG